MKKLVPLLGFAFLFLFVPSAYAAPGDGFEPGDNCGFLTGIGVVESNGGRLLFQTAVSDQNLACIDEDGYFYEDSFKNSFAFHTTHGLIDFTYYSSSSDPSDWAAIDLTTGQFTGFARMPALPPGDQELWFDWTCAVSTQTVEGEPCTEDSYVDRVTMDLQTGEVSGYAWNDSIGWVPFVGLSANPIQVELPPAHVDVTIEIVANGDGLTPSEVDLATAPLADGQEYWMLKMTLFDPVSGTYLDESAIEMASTNFFGATFRSGSGLFLDQINNEGDALEQSNYSPSEADFPTCIPLTGRAYCYYEDDGVPTFVKFVYGGAPTSNMLGLDSDQDGVVDYPSDRDGCAPQIYTNTGSTIRSEDECSPGSGNLLYKEDVFFARDTERNHLEINEVIVEIVFDTSQRYYVVNSYTGSSADEASLSFTDDRIYYTPPVEDRVLSYSPRYRLINYAAEYDGVENTQISTDTSRTDMYLLSEATVVEPSEAYVSSGSSVGVADTAIEVTHYVHGDYSSYQSGDLYLLIDDSVPADDVVDTVARTDSYLGNTATTINERFKMEYAELPICASFGACTASTPAPEPTNMTAEQWVCDQISFARYGSESCYITGYLPLLDRNAPKENMEVLGSVNSLIDVVALGGGTEILENNENVSVFGRADVVALRNKLFAQASRYALGLSLGSGSLDSSLDPSASSSVHSLLGGRLLLARGDVTIPGSSSFDDKTLVVFDGSVTIDGNITGGQLGLILFGDGADLYVHGDVTDLHVNAFLDGSVYSYDDNADLSGSYPVWDSVEAREEALQNQLYWKGSITSRNTIGGSEAEAYTEQGGYPLGDGSFTEDSGEAAARDLNQLREFHLCYPIDSSGNVDTSTTEDCELGESRASGYTSDAPFILDYAPSNDLPVFLIEGR